MIINGASSSPPFSPNLIFDKMFKLLLMHLMLGCCSSESWETEMRISLFAIDFILFSSFTAGRGVVVERVDGLRERASVGII